MRGLTFGERKAQGSLLDGSFGSRNVRASVELHGSPRAVEMSPLSADLYIQ